MAGWPLSQDVGSLGKDTVVKFIDEPLLCVVAARMMTTFADRHWLVLWALGYLIGDETFAIPCGRLCNLLHTRHRSTGPSRPVSFPLLLSPVRPYSPSWPKRLPSLPRGVHAPAAGTPTSAYMLLQGRGPSGEEIETMARASSSCHRFTTKLPLLRDAQRRFQAGVVTCGNRGVRLTPR